MQGLLGLLIYLIYIAIVWVAINVVYLILRRVAGDRVFSVELYYRVLFVVKRERALEPGVCKCRALPYIFIALYTVALAFSVFTLARMLYAGLLVGAREAVVLMPGLNVGGEDLLYFVVAVGVGVVTHEYLHAKLALSSGIPIKSYGFILALIFPGAFVEIDEGVFEKARRHLKLAVLSAGVVANFALALLSTLIIGLLTEPVGFLVVNVVPESPAHRAGLQPGDVVYEINGLEATLATLRELVSRAEAVEIKLLVYRPRVGYILVEVSKNLGERALGVVVFSAPSRSLVNTGLYDHLPVGLYVMLVKATMWLYIVNYSLTFINSLPLFVTDGAKILKYVAGDRVSKTTSYITLAALVVALMFGAKI